MPKAGLKLWVTNTSKTPSETNVLTQGLSKCHKRLEPLFLLRVGLTRGVACLSSVDMGQASR